MTSFKRNLFKRLAPVGLTAFLLSGPTAPPAHAQYVFEQNDNGQTVTNADGSQFTFPDNNLWTQPYTTNEDAQGNTYPNAYTNWTVLTSYPNGAGVTAIINGSCHLNENVSFQGVAVGSAGSLAIDSGNSGGAGNHSIAVTMAAGGAGTVQNAGSIVIGAALLQTTVTLANNLTLSGSGLYTLTNVSNVIQGPGTLILSPEVTLTGNGGSYISAPFANAGLLQSVGGGGLTLNPATATNTGTLAASGGAILTLNSVALNNAGGTLTVADTSSFILLDGATITGGTLTSDFDTSSDFNGGGYFRNDSSAALNNVTLSAGSAFYAVNPLALTGTLTNNGYIFLAGYNDNTRLYGGFTLAADATLAGTGITRLAGGEIDATNNATLTVAAGATIYGGPGSINASLINNGTVESVYQTLAIYSPTFTNNGVLAVVDQPGDRGNVILSLSGTTNLTNFNASNGTLTGGTYVVTDVGDGTYLEFGMGNVLVNAATITLSGAGANFSALNGLTTNAGNLSLLNLQQFTTSASLSNTGIISLDAGSTLHVGGQFTAGAASTLAVTVGGTFQVNYGPASAYAPGTLILSDFVQTGANIIPSFFTGQVNLGSGTDYLAFRNGNVFGYYGFLSDPRYIFHDDLGYEYVFDAKDGQDGVYLYDFASSHFFYTSPAFPFPFPYLYDFTLNTVLYYYPDPNHPGRYNTDGTRYFYDFATGQIITQ